jgi:hypothetical protein
MVELVGLKENNIEWLDKMKFRWNQYQQDNIMLVAKLSKGLCFVRVMAIKDEELILSFLRLC